MSKGLLEQFRDSIADKSPEKLQELRVELLTKSVGGGEQGPVERGAALAYVRAIDQELAGRRDTLNESKSKPAGQSAESRALPVG